MFAKVILKDTPKVLDKLLDYKVPDGMKLFVGDSIIVPFGVKNTPVQGYVAELSETSDHKAPKSIKEKSQLGRCFDEDMLFIIKWMRNKYLCNYKDAVSVVIPAGASSKTREWIFLEDLPEEKKYSEIVSILTENGGAMEYHTLCSHFEKSISGKISEMVKLGFLKREFSTTSSVKCKTVKAVRLKVDKAEAEYLKNAFSKKNPMWSQIIEILLLNEFVSVQDLKLFTNSSGSAISTLTKKGITEAFDAETFRLPKNKYKREGFVLGVGDNLFKIAGPVLVYGIGSSIICGFFYYIFTLIR